jgi:hypothetical protein
MGPRDLSRFAVDTAACAAIGSLFLPGVLAAIGAAGTILTAGAIVALAIRIHWSIR